MPASCLQPAVYRLPQHRLEKGSGVIFYLDICTDILADFSQINIDMNNRPLAVVAAV